MPALMRAEGGDPLPPTRPRAPQAEALRYVQFCIARLGSTDATVHNLAVRALHRTRILVYCSLQMACWLLHALEMLVTAPTSYSHPDILSASDGLLAAACAGGACDNSFSYCR